MITMNPQPDMPYRCVVESINRDLENYIFEATLRVEREKQINGTGVSGFQITLPFSHPLHCAASAYFVKGKQVNIRVSNPEKFDLPELSGRYVVLDAMKPDFPLREIDPVFEKTRPKGYPYPVNKPDNPDWKDLKTWPELVDELPLGDKTKNDLIKYWRKKEEEAA